MRTSLFVALFVAFAPEVARADAGDVQLELAGGYRSRASADLLIGGTLGLGDFTAARARAGIRLGDGLREEDGLPDGDGNIGGRLELTLAYAFDVLTLVPEISVGVAVDVDDADAILTGLGFLSLRRYVGRDEFLALELGGEVGPDHESFLGRLVWGF